MAYTESALVQPVILGGRRSPRRRGHRTGAGLDLGDDAGDHCGPDDVISAVVLAGDSVQALHVDGVESADGRFQLRAAGNALAMVLTSR